MRKAAVAIDGLAVLAQDETAALSAKVHAWAMQIADHFGDQWPHTPTCQGEAGCPLCLILEATRP